MMQLPISDDPRAVAFAFIDRWPHYFRSDFRTWLERNWDIWLMFQREANRIYGRRKHHSARRIVEWMRHETAATEGPDAEFKINGNYVPDLARLWLAFYPERKGFFQLRHEDDNEARAA